MKFLRYIKYQLRYDFGKVYCRMFGHKRSHCSQNINRDWGYFCLRRNCIHFEKENQ